MACGNLICFFYAGVHPLLCSQCAPEDPQQGEPVHVPRMQEDFPGFFFVNKVSLVFRTPLLVLLFHFESIVFVICCTCSDHLPSAERGEALQTCGNARQGELE